MHEYNNAVVGSEAFDNLLDGLLVGNCAAEDPSAANGIGKVEGVKCSFEQRCFAVFKQDTMQELQNLRQKDRLSKRLYLAHC